MGVAIILARAARARRQGSAVEGVRFRLLKLNLSQTELSDQAHLRNRVAYQCFGVDNLQPFERTPFGPDEISIIVSAYEDILKSLSLADR